MNFEIDDEKIYIEEDGKTIECDILFTFDSDDTNKSYVAYTDNTFEDGEKIIYVASYDPISNSSHLENVTDEKELKMVNDVFKEIYSEYGGEV